MSESHSADHSSGQVASNLSPVPEPVGPTDDGQSVKPTPPTSEPSGAEAHEPLLAAVEAPNAESGADHIGAVSPPMVEPHLSADNFSGLAPHSSGSQVAIAALDADAGSHELINPESLFAQAGQLQGPIALDEIDTHWQAGADHGAGWTSSTLEVDLTSAPSDPNTQGGWTVYVDHQPYVPSAHEQQLGTIHLDGPAHVSIVLYDLTGEPQSMAADHVDTITWGAGGHIG